MTTTAAAEAPRIAWWVYVGRERIRRTSTMRGRWSYDATCSCGWDTHTGGAVRSYIEREIWTHKYIDHELPLLRRVGSAAA
jgi:hypothetical protein